MVNQLHENREFKDSALGMIPKDWEVWNIEEIIYTIIDFRGRTPLKIGMTWGGGDIPALSANNVEMGKINLAKETNYGSEALYKKWMNKGDAKKGDIIITMEAPLGNIAQISDHRKYILSQRVILLKTKENLIYNDFLKNFLLSDLFQNRLKSYSSGTTATGIQQSKLLQLPIIVPPIPEQQQIAKILDTVDKAIAQTQTLIAKYKRVKTGLMQDLLTRGIDENGQLRDPKTHKFKRSPLGMIPDEWKICTLDEIINDAKGIIQTGPFGTQLHAHEYTTEGVPVIMPENIGDEGKINLDKAVKITPEKAKYLTRYAIRYNDVIFARRGDLSRCAVIKSDDWGICGTGCLLLRVSEDILLGDWMTLVYKHDYCQRQILSKAVGSTMVNLNTRLLTQLILAKPEIEEQSKIIKYINQNQELLDNQELFYQKFIKLKIGLMQDLLTGKTSVKPLLTNEP